MCESLVFLTNSLDVIKPSLHAVINDQDYGDRHQRILDSLIEGIMIVDNLGRIIQSNTPMVELFWTSFNPAPYPKSSKLINVPDFNSL